MSIPSITGTVITFLKLSRIKEIRKSHAPVSSNGRQQRGQPIPVDFAMGVQKDDNIPPGCFRSDRARPDQTLAITVPDQTHFAIELFDIIIELFL